MLFPTTATRTPHTRRTRPGFSMAELLIVLFIVVLLVAMLLPTIGRAREQARTTHCAANLHQVFVAATAWNADHQPEKVDAVGWMDQLLPYAKDKRLYQCIGSELQSEQLDKAATTTSTPTAPAPAPTSSPYAPLTTAFVRISAGSTWDVPVAEGPWFKKTNVTDNSYDLWLEDAGFEGGGDKDFGDVGLRVTDLGNGLSTITLLNRPTGKFSTYGSALMATTPAGTKTLMNDLYKSGAQGGTRTIVQTPPPGTNTGATGTGGFTTTTTPGSAVPADYGMNARAAKLFGQSGKVYMLDYTWSVADPDNDNWSQPKWLADPSGERLIFGRHFGRVNLLHADGAVILTPVSTTSVNPSFDSNRPTLWQP